MSYENGSMLDDAEQLPCSSTESTWRMAETDHRVANSFSLLASAINHRARQVSKQRRTMSSDDVALILDEIGSQIVAVGQLHRDIARQPDVEELDLNRYLWKLGEDLIAGLATPGRFDLHRGAHDACTMARDQALPLSLIVAEIVTNALKYAHPAGVRGKLTLGCRRGDDGTVMVEIADDGVGLPEGFDPAADGGLGAQTIALLANQLRAEVVYDSRPTGLCVRLRLPPPYSATSPDSA